MDNLVNGLADIVSKYDNHAIGVFFVFNVGLLIGLKRRIIKIKQKINPSSDKRYNVNVSMEWTNKEIQELSKSEAWIVGGYVAYANLTAVFPLLGILGTVAALVTYADTTDTMMDNFMVALSTTLFGVLAAIIFKVFDCLVAGDIEICREQIYDIRQNFDRKMRDSYEE